MMKNLVYGKQENGSKGGEESGYFYYIFQELKVEDRMGFKDMFRMSVSDYEFLSSQISDLIQPNERISGNRSVPSDEGLTLTLRYLATGDSINPLATNNECPWW